MSMSPTATVSRADAPSFAALPVALALAAFALCAFSLAVLNDGDTWSHVGTGEWILDHRAVPHVDPFSFTLAGEPWVAHEWLAEVLFALVYRAAGWAGVMLLTGAAAATATYVVARRVIAELPGVGGPALTFVSLAMATPSLLARPHLLALPVLAVWTAKLLEARDHDRPPPLALAALMILWANLHGGFAFGLALILPFSAEAVWAAPSSQKFAAVRGWVVFAILSFGAALLTPFGVEGLLFPIRLVGASQLVNIGEWRAEDFTHPGPLEIFLLCLIGFALIRPLRLAPLRVVLLVGLVHMALQHARHEMLLAVVAPMLLARPAAEALGLVAAPSLAARKWLAAGLVAALALAGVRLARSLPELDTSSAPSRALAAVPEDLLGKPVLNSYSFGGFLIFAKVRPFIDGRADLYGAKFLTRYARLSAGDVELLAETLKRYDIAWTLLSPDQGAVAALDKAPGWRRAYSDDHAVVHIRESHADAR